MRLHGSRILARPETIDDVVRNSGPYGAAEPHGATGNHRRRGLRVLRLHGSRILARQETIDDVVRNSGPYVLQNPMARPDPVDDMVRK